MLNKTRPFSFSISKTGCFNIVSHKSSGGYPTVSIDGQKMKAHRYIYEQCFGFIPKGKVVCHSCDNPFCINPEHLFLGTQLDNIKDRDKKGRQARGLQSGSSKLTPDEVVIIRSRYKAFDKKNGSRALAREYGVGHAAITSIITGQTWNWLSIGGRSA